MKNVSITESKNKDFYTVITVRFEEEGWTLKFEPNWVRLHCDGFPAIPETIFTKMHTEAFTEWVTAILEIYEADGWYKAITAIRNAKRESARV